ncbi:hypothetical protein D3C87_1397800 [compost metagenome]
MIEKAFGNGFALYLTKLAVDTIGRWAVGQQQNSSTGKIATLVGEQNTAGLTGAFCLSTAHILIQAIDCSMQRVRVGDAQGFDCLAVEVQHAGNCAHSKFSPACMLSGWP